MLYVGSIVSFFFFGTRYMKEALGYTAFQAGLGFLPMTLFTFSSAMAIPRISGMIGGVPMLMAALVFIAVGLVWMAEAGVDISYWQIALPMVLIGIGNGAAMAPLTTSGVRGVQSRDQGAASGLVNAAHQLGGSIGPSTLIVVFAANANSELSGPVGMEHQASAVFTAAAFMNVLALILTVVFIWPANRPERVLSIGKC